MEEQRALRARWAEDVIMDMERDEGGEHEWWMNERCMKKRKKVK